MFGFDVITAGKLLVLATATASTVQCAVPQAPQISVTPLSAPVQYEFGLSAEQIGKFKSDTINPYAPGTDTTTQGLRHDRPELKTEVHWRTRHYESRKLTCLWYDTINVTINLSPKIYIARDHSNDVCRKAIMEHELKHVTVDRDVINHYAQQIGGAVKQAVDDAGPMGPYNDDEVDHVQQELIHNIETAVATKEFSLYQEMARRQALVDSLSEYERVNKICEEAEKK